MPLHSTVERSCLEFFAINYSVNDVDCNQGQGCKDCFRGGFSVQHNRAAAAATHKQENALKLVICWFVGSSHLKLSYNSKHEPVKNQILLPVLHSLDCPHSQIWAK